MIDISIYEKFLADGVASLKIYKARRDSQIKSKLEAEKNLSEYEKAREIINSVGIISQKKIHAVLESIVTDAFQFVFGQNYKFTIETRIARNQPETMFYLAVDGNKRQLHEDSGGGGGIDVASFALRLCFWALSATRSSNTIILDEPGKNIDKDRLLLFGRILTKFCDLLGVQFIISSHEDSLIEIADTAYMVENVGSESIVKHV